jgi:VWFA-related protein
MMHGRVLLAALLTSSILFPILGQQPSPSSSAPATQTKPQGEDQDVVRITTNLVQVDVSVTRDGKQVTDLKPEDFELFEDGRPQQITTFSYISNVADVASSKSAPVRDKDAPVVPPALHPHDVRRTVAFVVDDLGMSFESMGQARRQLRKFVDEELQPNDLVAIIRTGGDVGSLQQFTNDKRVLHSAIDNLKWNLCSRTKFNVFQPPRSAFLLSSPEAAKQGPCGEELIRNIQYSLDAIRFVVRGMGPLPGRKAAMIFSDSIPIEIERDGGPNQSQPGDQGNSSPSGNEGLKGTDSYEGALRVVAEQAIRSSVVLYAVDTRGLQYTGVTAMDAVPADRMTLMTRMGDTLASRSAMLLANREGSDLMARQTGGFLIRNSNDFGIDRVMDDQRGYYLLGYRPTDQTFNRRFHQIKARVKQRGLTLRTRAGFFGVSEDQARSPELASADQMRLALMTPFGGSDIDLRLTSFFANEAAGSLLRSFIHLGAHDLTFSKDPDGTEVGNLALSTALFGDNGRVVSKQDRNATIRLSGEAYERAQREGLVYSFDTPVKKSGAFQFRVAVRDQGSARIGAAGQFVAVPDLRRDRLALSGIVLHKSPSSTEAAGSDGEITAGPAVRRFHQGTSLDAAYAVYNAPLDKSTNLPQLTTQIRIFRDGKAVFTGTETPLNAAGQVDLKRLIANSVVQLDSEFVPGDYVLQIIVEDHLGKEKRHAIQWIDFEVIR